MFLQKVILDNSYLSVFQSFMKDDKQVVSARYKFILPMAGIQKPIFRGDTGTNIYPVRELAKKLEVYIKLYKKDGQVFLNFFKQSKDPKPLIEYQYAPSRGRFYPLRKCHQIFMGDFMKDQNLIEGQRSIRLPFLGDAEYLRLVVAEGDGETSLLFLRRFISEMPWYELIFLNHQFYLEVFKSKNDRKCLARMSRNLDTKSFTIGSQIRLDNHFQIPFEAFLNSKDILTDRYELKNLAKNHMKMICEGDDYTYLSPQISKRLQKKLPVYLQLVREQNKVKLYVYSGEKTKQPIIVLLRTEMFKRFVLESEYETFMRLFYTQKLNQDSRIFDPAFRFKVSESNRFTVGRGDIPSSFGAVILQVGLPFWIQPMNEKGQKYLNIYKSEKGGQPLIRMQRMESEKRYSYEDYRKNMPKKAVFKNDILLSDRDGKTEKVYFEETFEHRYLRVFSRQKVTSFKFMSGKSFYLQAVKKNGDLSLLVFENVEEKIPVYVMNFSQKDNRFLRLGYVVYNPKQKNQPHKTKLNSAPVLAPIPTPIPKATPIFVPPVTLVLTEKVSAFSAQEAKDHFKKFYEKNWSKSALLKIKTTNEWRPWEDSEPIDLSIWIDKFSNPFFLAQMSRSGNETYLTLLNVKQEVIVRLQYFDPIGIWVSVGC